MKIKGGSERFTYFASRISRRPCGGLARRLSGGFTSLWLVYPPLFSSAVFMAGWRA